MAQCKFFRRWWRVGDYDCDCELDDCEKESLYKRLCEFEKKIMATLDTLSADNAAALASVTTFIAAVGTEVAALSQQISDLKASLGNLTPEDQAKVDAADANAQAISAGIADATSKLPTV